MTKELENGAFIEEPQKKKPKRGIIYLSTIPPYMNVTKIREIFSEFGSVGRVFLQLAEIESGKKTKKRIAKKFIEGWVEFEKKSVARKVALLLNNQQVSNRKKSKHFDYTWNIKYLSGFKWIHLHERLAYEKAARRQKLRAEIQLAKKKTNFFTANLGKRNKNTQIDSKNVLQINTQSTNDVKCDSLQNREEFISSLFK